MQPDEAVRRLHRRLVLIGLVVGVNQLELRLLGVFAEGVARFQQLQAAHRLVVAFVRDEFLDLPVHVLLPGIGHFGKLVIAGATPQGQADEQEQDVFQ